LFYSNHGGSGVADGQQEWAHGDGWRR